jgi:hypothetical protein
VLWAIEYDIARAASARSLEQTGFGVKRIPGLIESGKIVRIQENVVIVRDLPGTRAKGTPIGRHLRPVLTVGSYHDPLLEQRMPT